MTERPSEWLIYALGGGWGHLTRAAALARQAPQDLRVRILTNSPYVEAVRRGLPSIDIVAIDPEWEMGPTKKYAAQVIQESPQQWLIVDTFPRGLGGELAPWLAALPCRKALIHRDLNPEYMRRMMVHEFVRTTYDLVFGVDAAPSDLAGLPQFLRTLPWVIRSAVELPRAEAPQYILVCAAGNPEELVWYEEVAQALRGSISEFETRVVTSEWPAMDLIPAARIVVGGAGYNTVHECAACGVPLVARAWPRRYDRQRLRAELVSQLSPIALVETAAEAVSAVAAFLREPPPMRLLAFINGAEEAATRLI